MAYSDRIAMIYIVRTVLQFQYINGCNSWYGLNFDPTPQSKGGSKKMLSQTTVNELNPVFAGDLSGTSARRIAGKGKCRLKEALASRNSNRSSSV